LAKQDRTFFIILAPLLLVILAAPTARAAARQEQQDAKTTEIMTQITRYVKELAGKPDDAAREICARSSESLMDVDAVVKVGSEDIRNKMTPAQRSAYREAALAWIIRHCVRENRGNKGEEPQVMGVRQGESGDRLLALKTEDPAHFVVWRLRGVGKLRVVDVVMDGVSMALTLRDETSDRLRQDDNNIDAMIRALNPKGREVNER
jgi:ABC-type transporter MlaC component